jgi:hypothetical protein
MVRGKFGGIEGIGVINIGDEGGEDAVRSMTP